MTSDPYSHAASKPADWTASDALVLEGLSGLDELMVSHPDDGAQDNPAVGMSSSSSGQTSQGQNLTCSQEQAPVPTTSGFGTARELRAAQERFAAQKRSAARRREHTQGVGFNPQVQDRMMADSERVSRSFAKPGATPSPIVSAPRCKPEVPPSTVAAPTVDHSASSLTRPSSRRTVRVPLPLPSPLPESQSSRGVESKRSDQGNTVLRKKREHDEFSEDVDQSKVSSPKTVERQQRVVDPQITRERSSSSSSGKLSWGTTVLLSVLATSLMWSAVGFAVWKSDLLQNHFSALIEPKQAEIEETVGALETKVIKLTGEHVVLKGRFENGIQMESLEKEIFTTHSRQRFDEFLALGKRISPALAYEADLFKQVKNRIEQAYTQKVKEHKGLDVASLFPKSKASRDSTLKSSELVEYMVNSDEPSWNRARAAYLLRIHKDNDEVIGGLLQVIRDDSDLQVMFAAWDSLVQLTGYEDSNGFDPESFRDWWRNPRG